MKRLPSDESHEKYLFPPRMLFWLAGRDPNGPPLSDDPMSATLVAGFQSVSVDAVSSGCHIDYWSSGRIAGIRPPADWRYHMRFYNGLPGFSADGIRAMMMGQPENIVIVRVATRGELFSGEVLRQIASHEHVVSWHASIVHHPHLMRIDITNDGPDVTISSMMPRHGDGNDDSRREMGIFDNVNYVVGYLS